MAPTTTTPATMAAAGHRWSDDDAPELNRGPEVEGTDGKMRPGSETVLIVIRDECRMSMTTPATIPAIAPSTKTITMAFSHQRISISSRTS